MAAPTGDAREWLNVEAVPCRRPGDRYLRVRRNRLTGFGREGGLLVVTPAEADRPGPLIRALTAAAHLLLTTGMATTLLVLRAGRGRRSGSPEAGLRIGPVLVPILRPGPASAVALAYAHRLSRHPRPVWLEGRPRSVLLRQLDLLCAADPGCCVTVVLPESARSLLQEVLREPGLAWLKLQLLARRGVVVACLPARAGSEGQVATGSAQLIGLVPLARLDAASARALSYAHSVMDQVVAVHVEQGQSEQLRAAFELWVRDLAEPERASLVVIASPSGGVCRPLVKYFRSWRSAHPERVSTVVLPERVDAGLWTALPHHHRAFWLKTALLAESSLAVADVNV